MKRVYWASPLFTDAQRDFNAAWAATLREAHFDVVLPQEFAANDPGHTPSASEIFGNDTAEILKCDVLVGVVDDETIDSGVATEIGIAHAAGAAVIGVYTDIRRDRPEGRMYKNLYVLGLIENSLGIMHTKEQLRDALTAWRERSEHLEAPPADGRIHGGAFDEFIRRLEQRYQPPWSSYDSVIDTLQRLAPSQIIDFGCGSGRLAQRMVDFGLEISYFGYDVDVAQIVAARARELGSSVTFSSSFTDLIEAVRSTPIDRLMNMSFVLHDLADLVDLRAVTCYLETSTVLIHDLCSGDLPRVTELLSLAAGKPFDFRLDRRLSIDRLQSVSEELRMTIEQVEPISLKVTFPDRTELLTYCDAFGLFSGQDIPIAPHMNAATLRANFERVLEGVQFPMQDKRLFAKVVARIR